MSGQGISANNFGNSQMKAILETLNERGILVLQPDTLELVDQVFGVYSDRGLSLLFLRAELGSMARFSAPRAPVLLGMACGGTSFWHLPVKAYGETVHRDESSLLVLPSGASGSVPELCPFAFGEWVVVVSEAGGVDPPTQACTRLKKLGHFGILCAIVSTFLPAV